MTFLVQKDCNGLIVTGKDSIPTFLTLCRMNKKLELISSLFYVDNHI
jgi:hypothetical protein